jgi:hypothetical protein
MRLPTVTVKQGCIEDARELHEAIWAAHLKREAHVLDGLAEPKYSSRAAALQGNLHSFWIARGFKLSVKLNSERRVAITLSAAPAKQRTNHPVVDPSWNQPAVRVA